MFVKVLIEVGVFLWYTTSMADMKRLYRSTKNKTVAGIFGGLGEYLDVDPTLLRLGYVLVTAFTGFLPGIMAYIVAALIIPKPR